VTAITNEVILAGVCPLLVTKLTTQVYPAMAALGLPMRPLEGVRTVTEQQARYAEGRTVPGQIVTFCDGVTTPSNHQVKPDGYGHAVDSVFVGLDPYLEHDPLSTVKWACYGAILEALGIRWGGRFRSVDLDHAEIV
jgi:hypothetical protein